MASALALRNDSVVQAAPGAIRVSDIIAGLSRALDLTEGHPQGHAARTCLIGMRIASMLRLSSTDASDLFYALLLKDAGCSSNAARVHQLFGGSDHDAKRAVWLRDWRRFPEKVAYGLEYAGRGERWWRRLGRIMHLAIVGPAAERALFQVRCDRGAAIALDLGLSPATAEAIRCMDEHWDGGGQPAGLSGDRIQLLGQIVGLAQVLEIFAADRGPAEAADVARRRSGRWFNPALVKTAEALASDSAFWQEITTMDPTHLLATAEPASAIVFANDEALDRIAEAFASVIDAKSPFTSEHSRRVASYAAQAAAHLDFDAPAAVRLRRCALLHDIGKLAVPNSVLDKPAALTPDEWRMVRAHPAHTFEILHAVPVFSDLAFDASSHHEKLNGGGYHRGLGGSDLSSCARLLATADITDALLADRPYRPGMSVEEVVTILQEERASGALAGDTVEAMIEVLGAQ